MQLLLVRTFASARVVHHKTAGLRPGEVINGEFSTQQFLLQIEKSPAGAGRVVWRGVDEMFDIRHGWHTIPVKLLSQLWSLMLFKFLDESFQV